MNKAGEVAPNAAPVADQLEWYAEVLAIVAELGALVEAQKAR